MMKFNNFQELEEEIWQLRYQEIERLVETLENCEPFDLGYCKGYMDCAEEIARGIKQKLKHSDDMDYVEDEIELG